MTQCKVTNVTWFRNLTLNQTRKLKRKVLMNIPVIPANMSMSQGDRLQIRRFLNIGFHCETFLIDGKT